MNHIQKFPKSKQTSNSRVITSIKIMEFYKESQGRIKPDSLKGPSKNTSFEDNHQGVFGGDETACFSDSM